VCITQDLKSLNHFIDLIHHFQYILNMYTLISQVFIGGVYLKLNIEERNPYVNILYLTINHGMLKVIGY